MKKDIKFYLKLFSSTFYLSAFTFGGGFIIIPLMKKQFVERYHWIGEKEMLDLTAIAQSSPGAIAVNAAILIGFRMAGVMGAVITVLGTVLPPLLILSVVSVAYTAFRDNLIIRYILRGMQAGVAAVIFDVVFSMAQDLLREKKKMPLAVLAVAFIATFVLKIKVIFVILASGLIGVISLHYEKHRKKSGKQI